MKPNLFQKKLTLIQWLMLAYFMLLLAAGLPLALWSVKQAIDYRSRAAKVTITATIPHTPLNTPNYGENGNKPPEITAPRNIYLSPGDFTTIPVTITDPDWVKNQPSPQTIFSSARALPPTLKILCSTKTKTKSCLLTGLLSQSLSKPQLLKISARDVYGATSIKLITLSTNK